MNKEMILQCQRLAAVIVAGTAAAWPECEGARMDSAPAVPSYAQQTTQTLNAQIKEAPALFNANAQYQPMYAGLNLSDLGTLLNGQTNPWGVQTTPGLLSQYVNNVMPAVTQAQNTAATSQAQNTINNVQTLGPQFNAALDASNPAASGLLSQLTTQANSEMQAGTQLTADQQRQLNNQVNASEASRGMAYGPAGSYANVLANSQAGTQMQQQRQQFAAGVMGQNTAFYTDPFLSILGQPSAAASTAQGLLGQGAGLIPGTQFNPQAGESVANSQAQTASANAASGNSLMGSLIGGGLSSLGALGSGIGSIAGTSGSSGSSVASGVSSGLGMLGSLFALL